MANIENLMSGQQIRTILNATGLKPSSFEETTAPGPNDDDSNTGGAGFNFEIGSVWVDATLDHAYFCADAATGAAVWHRFGAQKSSGSCYISSAMTSAPAGTPVKIGAASGATTAIDLVQFTHTTPGRLVYTGLGTEKFVMSANLSMTHSGSNVLATFYVAINGTIAAGSRIDRKIGSGSDAGSASVRWLSSLSPNDYVEIFASIPSGTLSIDYGTIDIALRGN